MSQRIDGPRPLFGDRWPDPPEPDWGIRVRHAEPDALQTPQDSAQAPALTVDARPGRVRAEALQRAAEAAARGIDELILAVDWLADVEAGAHDRYRVLLEKCVGLGEYIDTIRGRK